MFSLFRDQNICGFLSHFKWVENVILLKFHMFRIQELFFIWDVKKLVAILQLKVIQMGDDGVTTLCLIRLGF